MRFNGRLMGAEESERAVPATERFFLRRLEPADFFGGVTVIGALAAVTVGALSSTIFLAGTFLALIAARCLELPRAFELAVAIGIVLQGWGNALLLFERVGWYDKAVHFLTPMLMVPALCVLLARAGVLPSPWRAGLRRGILGTFVITLALGFALAAAWELVEGSSDRLFGSSLAHGYFETIDDLYSSLLGSVAAGALLAWLALTGRDLSEECVEALPERN